MISHTLPEGPLSNAAMTRELALSARRVIEALELEKLVQVFFNPARAQIVVHDPQHLLPDAAIFGALDDSLRENTDPSLRTAVYLVLTGRHPFYKL